MVPKPSTFGTTAAKVSTPRLAVAKLKVRSSNLKAAEANPCLDLMTAVLGTCPPRAKISTDASSGCWASNGHVSAVCLNLEQQLRTCMDSKVWIYTPQPWC
jgi:hypothetical protein